MLRARRVQDAALETRAAPDAIDTVALMDDPLIGDVQRLLTEAEVDQGVDAESLAGLAGCDEADARAALEELERRDVAWRDQNGRWHPGQAPDPPTIDQV
jgi:hypothetical protein